jgi:hypothetical protein
VVGLGSGSAGGVRTRGVGKRGQATDKGKEKDDELIGIIKGVAIATSPLLAGLKNASRAVACAPLSPHPWSLRAPLVFSVPSLPKPSPPSPPLSGGAASSVALNP